MYKKIFMGIAAVAALTLVSCSSDDLNSLSDNSSKNEAISFDGYWGRSAVSVNGSRGSVIDKAEDLQKVSEGFGVFGNYSSTDGEAFGSNLFENQKVTYSTEETKWTYSPKKYWSPQGHIDFLAYAPRVEGTKLKDNTSCIEFTVADKAAAQKDLLWANAANQTMAKNSGTDKKVNFKFAHALSRLGYTVKTNTTSSDVTITLKKITLAGSVDETTKAFYTAGTIDLSKANNATDLWTITTPATKQNFTWFSGTQEVTSTLASNPNTGYLFVIPQDFSKTEENADALYVIVEYTIQNGTTETMTSTVSSKLAKKLEQGKAYTINLTLGLTPIEFDASVEKWTDFNQKDIDAWN